MSDQTELQQFAERLIQRVRDRAIAACDHLATGEVQGPLGQRWRAVMAGGDARHALTTLIPDIADQVLFELLNAVDNGELPLGWRRTDHSFVALDELGMGEMAGWLMMGQEGWRNQFSQQRFLDPHADPKLEEDASM